MTGIHDIETGLSVALRRLGLGMALMAGSLLGLAVLGALLIAGHAEAERERALAGWQARLGVIADARAAEVSRWLARQFEAVGEVAENESVQLYTAALSEGGSNAAAIVAQQGYLQNYLTALAAQGGFTPGRSGIEIAANVRRVGIAGLIIADAAGRVLAATPDAPPLDGDWTAFLERIPPGRRALRDVRLSAAGTPVIGVVAPLFGARTADGTPRQAGFVVGVREVADALFPLLAQPGAAENTLETVLVRRADGAVEYISPLMNGAAPLERRMAVDAPHLAAAFALRTPGGFGIYRDYAGAEVLVTARGIAGAPWALATKVGRGEALGPSEERIARQIAIFGALLAAVMVAVLAAWRHGASSRTRDALARLRAVSAALEDRERLLRSISDTVPDAVVLADRDARVRFANREAGRRVGIDGAALAGKTLESAFGPAEGARYAEGGRRALAGRAPVTAQHRIGMNGSTQMLQARFVPLMGSEEFLVVETDVTETMRERERREAMLSSLVGALVRLADQRDPMAAGQSARVAETAAAIATEMGLDGEMIDCAHTAGRLVNFYKILVPAPLLTRSSPLDETEVAMLHDAMATSARTLKDIEFGSPVAETLRQLNERYDGSGRPDGLSGGDIVPTAQIVALANAFVAMTSDRSYRARLSLTEAIAAINDEGGKAFSPAVVAAFVNYMENRGGRTRWAAQPDLPAAT